MIVWVLYVWPTVRNRKSLRPVFRRDDGTVTTASIAALTRPVPTAIHCVLESTSTARLNVPVPSAHAGLIVISRFRDAWDESRFRKNGCVVHHESFTSLGKLVDDWVSRLIALVA